MNETTFWQMIEQAKADSGGDGEEQVHLLADRLSQLEIGEIMGFAYLFDKFHAVAYRFDLWEASGIVDNSIDSNDAGFIDFRAWLIAQGKDIYEQVLSDPDWLAQVVDVIEDETRGNCAAIMLEAMNYVAYRAYEIKMGAGERMPFVSIEYLILRGAWSSKDELPQKCPQLWALFKTQQE